jgi:hypothetical protein
MLNVCPDVFVWSLVSEPYPVLETKVVSRVQDIIGETSNTVVFGVSAATLGRGRYQIMIPDAELGLGNFGLKFEKLDTSASYQKTYQSYILNKENNGELYLMVVGSETGSDSTSRIFNENSNNDTIDIFQIPGRPLTVRRSE